MSADLVDDEYDYVKAVEAFDESGICIIQTPVDEYGGVQEMLSELLSTIKCENVAKLNYTDSSHARGIMHNAALFNLPGVWKVRESPTLHRLASVILRQPRLLVSIQGSIVAKFHIASNHARRIPLNYRLQGMLMYQTCKFSFMSEHTGRCVDIVSVDAGSVVFWNHKLVYPQYLKDEIYLGMHIGYIWSDEDLNASKITKVMTEADQSWPVLKTTRPSNDIMLDRFFAYNYNAAPLVDFFNHRIRTEAYTHETRSPPRLSRLGMKLLGLVPWKSPGQVILEGATIFDVDQQKIVEMKMVGDSEGIRTAKTDAITYGIETKTKIECRSPRPVRAVVEVENWFFEVDTAYNDEDIARFGETTAHSIQTTDIRVPLGISPQEIESMKAAQQSRSIGAFKQFCAHRLWSCADIDNLLTPVMEYMVARGEIQDPDQCMRIVLRKCPSEIISNTKTNRENCSNNAKKYKIFRVIKDLYDDQ
jgi:hypothetical protein